MKPITLEGFADKFAASDDPWSTFQSRDEALKRQAIVHALGPTTRGRVLELAAGNGSNSVALARRSLQLDATEATEAGTKLVARAIADRSPRARALRLAVPARFPRPAYDAIIVAELLYYLSPRAMTETARDVAVALRGGGRLVLAHHHVDFYDFVQHAAGLQYRFLAETGTRWRVRTVRRTRKWSVLSCTRTGLDPLFLADGRGDSARPNGAAAGRAGSRGRARADPADRQRHARSRSRLPVSNRAGRQRWFGDSEQRG